MPKRNSSHPTGDKTPKKTPARKRQPPSRLGHEEENQRPKEPRQQSPAVNSDSNQDIIASLVQSQILMQAQMDTLTEKVDQLVSGQTHTNEGSPGVSVRCTGNPRSVNVTQTHTENPLITTANHGNTHSAPSTGVSVRCSGNENNTKGPENITLDPQPSTSTGANGSTSGAGEFLTLPFAHSAIRPIHSGGTTIGQAVKQALKTKIWEHKFVDLSELLYPNDIRGYNLSVVNNDQPALSLEPKKGRPMSEQDWGAAFDIFVAVYVEKYPDELNAILTYAQHVKDQMRNGAHWRMYDTQFRRDREFTKCSWQMVRQDLELRAFRPPQQQQAPRSNNAFKPKLSKGYCFAYHNKDKVCTRDNCRFKHTCPRCGGPHPQYLRCNSSTKPVQQKPTNPRKSQGSEWASARLPQCWKGGVWVYPRIHARF